ncbi:MAG: hypothetical protein AB7K67_05925 [Hyphomicrobiaceae bacterium]|jgi:hypothetical protein
MKRFYLSAVAGAVLGLGFAVSGAQAAPASNLPMSLKTDAAQHNMTKEVRWRRVCNRRCWRDWRGFRQCRTVCRRHWW